MGVLACDRKGCSHIMCDRYSDEYGYICNSCYFELQKTKPDSISEFMNSYKYTPSTDYNSIFKDYSQDY